VIVALHTQHRLSDSDVVQWSDLAGEPFLIPESGPGPELERPLIARLGGYGPQRVLHQECSLDRLLSLVAAEYDGALLMFEGATGVRYDHVIYREVHDGEGATRINFAAYWCQTNANPVLGPFLALLRQRYPDLSGELGAR
jgi:hypothetical protein